MQINPAGGGTPLEYQPAAVRHHDRQEVGEIAKQVQQDIGKPGPDNAAGIVYFRHRTAV